MTLNNVDEKMIKKEVFRYFHIFTDNIDEYIHIKDDYYDRLKEAEEIKNSWLQRGYKNIRIYFVHEEEDHRDGEILLLEENCIYSLGNFPS